MFHIFILLHLINSSLPITNRELVMSNNITYYGNIYQKVSPNLYELALQLYFTDSNTTDIYQSRQYQSDIICLRTDYSRGYYNWFCNGSLRVNETMLTTSYYNINDIRCDDNNNCVLRISSHHDNFSVFLLS